MDNWIELLTFFLAVAGAVAGIMMALIHLIRRTVTFEHKTLKNEGDIAEHKKDISRIDEKLDRLSEGFAEMKGQLNEIAKVNFASSSSPLTLNDVGEKISKGIDAPDIAKRYAVLVKIPPNADELEIQETSFEYASRNLLNELNGEEVKKLRKYAFDSGNNMYSVLSIIGFELRDIILKERGFFPDRLKKKG